LCDVYQSDITCHDPSSYSQWHTGWMSNNMMDITQFNTEIYDLQRINGSVYIHPSCTMAAAASAAEIASLQQRIEHLKWVDNVAYLGFLHEDLSLDNWRPHSVRKLFVFGGNSLTNTDFMENFEEIEMVLIDGNAVTNVTGLRNLRRTGSFILGGGVNGAEGDVCSSLNNISSIALTTVNASSFDNFFDAAFYDVIRAAASERFGLWANIHYNPLGFTEPFTGIWIRGFQQLTSIAALDSLQAFEGSLRIGWYMDNITLTTGTYGPNIGGYEIDLVEDNFNGTLEMRTSALPAMDACLYTPCGGGSLHIHNCPHAIV